MKKILFFIVSLFSISIVLFIIYTNNYDDMSERNGYCLTGAFIADNPTAEDLDSFKQDYGKGAFLVLVFMDWEGFVEQKILEDILSEGSLPVVSWEPWRWEDKEGILPEDILSGRFDDYISEFARRLGSLEETVYLRFAHEMNGDWYPWSTALIGPQSYRKMYRYIKDKFDALEVDNIKWIFAINWENIPQDNCYRKAYPGDDYVDIIGIDGYNWGTSQAWSRWMSFSEIFRPIYKEIDSLFEKEIMIAEFGSTSQGGDKSKWIKDALSDIKKMPEVKSFILFNVDKETDWKFSPEKPCGKALKKALKDPYFFDNLNIKNKNNE